MKLSEEEIRRFQKLFEEEYGQLISEKEVKEYAEALIAIASLFVSFPDNPYD
jgi:hypothetical protein